MYSLEDILTLERVKSWRFYGTFCYLYFLAALNIQEEGQFIISDFSQGLPGETFFINLNGVQIVQRGGKEKTNGNEERKERVSNKKRE